MSFLTYLKDFFLSSRPKQELDPCKYNFQHDHCFGSDCDLEDCKCECHWDGIGR